MNTLIRSNYKSIPAITEAPSGIIDALTSPVFNQGNDVVIPLILSYQKKPIELSHWKLEVFVKESITSSSVLYYASINNGLTQGSDDQFILSIPGKISALFVSGIYYYTVKGTQRIGTGEYFKDICVDLLSSTFTISVSASAPTPVLTNSTWKYRPFISSVITPPTYTSGTLIPISDNNSSFPGFGDTDVLACVGNDPRLSDARVPLSHEQDWSTILGKPTTLAGYGITDTVSASWGSLSGKPTTLSGYGITDAFNGTWDSLSGKPTTFTPIAHTHVAVDITNLGADQVPPSETRFWYTAAIEARVAADDLKVSFPGFGTTGVLTCVGNDPRLSDARTPVAHNQAWSTISTTPTTIAGYGITDAFNGTWTSLTGKPTTFSPSTHTHVSVDISDLTAATVAPTAARLWWTPTLQTTLDANTAKVTFPGFGTTGILACAGNDARLSDARTPLAHNHTSLTITDLSADTVTPTASRQWYTPAIEARIVADDLKISFPGFGTTGILACVGNDARLSDARTPLAHDHAFNTLTGLPSTLAGYGITDSFDGTFAALTDKPNTLAGYGIIDGGGEPSGGVSAAFAIAMSVVMG